MGLHVALVLAAVASAPPPATATCSKPPEQVIRRDFNRFVDMLLVERTPQQAFEAYAVPGLVQHSKDFGPDRAATIAQWNTLMTPVSTFGIKGVSIEGGIGLVRFRGHLNATGIGANVTNYYRFDCGKIVEAWDVLDITP